MAPGARDREINDSGQAYLDERSTSRPAMHRSNGHGLNPPRRAQGALCGFHARSAITTAETINPRLSFAIDRDTPWPYVEVGLKGEPDSPEALKLALTGDAASLWTIVDSWAPVVQARVVRVLNRQGYRRGPRIRQEVEDLVQEVFVSLFEKDARALRSWKPEGRLSLQNWVGLIAEQQVTMILRTRKRNPWTEDPTPIGRLDRPAESANPQDVTIAADKLERLLDLLQEELSPLGWTLFKKLYVEEASVAEVVNALGMSREAVYAWRSRLRRTSRQLRARLMSESAGSDQISP